MKTTFPITKLEARFNGVSVSEYHKRRNNGHGQLGGS
jgi:hypothetical protein